MKNLSKVEIDNLISTIKEKDKLMKSYCISYFIDNAFYSDNYEPDNIWFDIVV